MAILPIFAVAVQCEICDARGPVCGDDFPLAEKLAIEAGFKVLPGKDPNPPIAPMMLVTEDGVGPAHQIVVNEEVEAARAIMRVRVNRHLCQSCVKSIT